MIPTVVILFILASALAGRWAARGRDRPSRLLASSVGAGVAVASSLVVLSGLSAPFSPWDSVRLAPAMALLRGVNPYASSSSGAVLSTMYGPVAMAAYVPAALVGDSATAATLGRWVAFTFCVLPLIACCRPLARDEGRGWRLAVLTACTLAMLQLPALRYSTTYLHADAPALGLSGLACLLASRKSGPGVAAALACVLALWTKQTMAPLPLALIAWAWISGGAVRGMRFAATLAAVGLGSLAVVAWLFDFRSIYLNLVQIPGGVPWRGQAPWNLAATSSEFAIHAVPLLLAGWIAIRSGSATIDDDALRRSRVFAMAAIALAPMAVLGRVKQAGDLNSFGPSLYPLLLAVACRFTAIAVPEPRRLLAATIAGMVLLGGFEMIDEARILTLERPRDAESAYLAAHPGTVYFPWNPAVHLEVEGRATHHLFSAWERGVAGFPVSASHLRSALPPCCLYVAFPLKRLGPVVGFGSCVQMLSRDGLLAAPAVPVRLAGLPDYECYALVR